jgi:orotidine-5'-phosphate decarboxylase
MEANLMSRIIVGLDFADARSALGIVERLDPKLCALKIGKELFTAEGPPIVRECVARGYRVFLDLKFHDIPNTVAKACAAATRLGVWMLNVHAAGGAAMLAAAREAVEQAAREQGREPPALIAVTVLTSLAAADLAAIGVPDAPATQVTRLARLAQSSGLGGVVCAAHEAKMLRDACGSSFRLVTPGIRPAGSDANDQARVSTPEDAIRAGADHLVIGRPIAQARDPRRALEAIHASIEALA